ncbi:hypothetical protein CHUAL_012343 [Chamberlinius hualienensis]
MLQTEKAFSDTQDLRRSGQTKILEIHNKLKDIRLELDKTSRVEDRYLQLVTKEHSIIKEERKLQEELRNYEKEERERFQSLTNSVRESHEKERSYAEKTKYWSVIGSVVGALVGIAGTAYNNRKRLKELRNIVVESIESSTSTVQEIRSVLSQFQLQDQEQIAQKLLKIANKATLQNNSIKDAAISNKLDELKKVLTDRLVVLNSCNSHDVIYVTKDFEKIIKDSENRLQSKMQMNSAVTVAVLSGALVVSIGIVYKLFGS